MNDNDIEMGPIDYGPGEAVGAPDHPHRGFETVTYVLEGEMEHEDSAGHRGALRSGGTDTDSPFVDDRLDNADQDDEQKKQQRQVPDVEREREQPREENG